MKNIPLLLNIALNLLALSYFPTQEAVSTEDIAGLTSLAACLIYLNYVEYHYVSIFFRHKYFIPFDLSHLQILMLEVKEFFLKWPTIISLFMFLSVFNLKFYASSDLGLILFNLQIIFGLSGGVILLIQMTHILMNLLSEFNPFIFFIRLVISLVVLVILKLTPFIIPFGGIYFAGFYLLKPLWQSVLINISILLFTALVLSKIIVLTYKTEKWLKN